MITLSIGTVVAIIFVAFILMSLAYRAGAKDKKTESDERIAMEALRLTEREKSLSAAESQLAERQRTISKKESTLFLLEYQLREEIHDVTKTHMAIREKIHDEAKKRMIGRLINAANRKPYRDSLVFAKMISPEFSRTDKRFREAIYQAMRFVAPISAATQIKTRSGNVYDVSLSACTCKDFEMNRIPCKHMYRLGIEMGILASLDSIGCNNADPSDEKPSFEEWSASNPDVYLG